MGRNVTYGLYVDGLSSDELLTECLPVAIFTGLLNNNLLVVIGKFVENELDLLVELELVEFCDTVWVD